MLVGCGTVTLPKLDKFERPSKFPETCEWVQNGLEVCKKLKAIGEACIVNPEHENYICRPAVIWDHTSESRSCLSQDDFLLVTKHVVELNHVIDLHEIQVDEWNDQ